MTSSRSRSNNRGVPPGPADGTGAQFSLSLTHARTHSLVLGELVLQQSHVVGRDESGLQGARQLLGQHVVAPFLQHRQLVALLHRQLVVAAGLEVEERRVQLHRPLLGRRDADVPGHGADLGRLRGGGRVGDDMVLIGDVRVAEVGPNAVPEAVETRHTGAAAALHPGTWSGGGGGFLRID